MLSVRFQRFTRSRNFSERFTMIDTKTAPYAALLMRVALGVMFIAHGLLKVLVFTLPGTVGFFQSVGLPGFLAYVTTFAEMRKRLEDARGHDRLGRMEIRLTKFEMNDGASLMLKFLGARVHAKRAFAGKYGHSGR